MFRLESVKYTFKGGLQKELQAKIWGGQHNYQAHQHGNNDIKWKQARGAAKPINPAITVKEQVYVHDIILL